MLSELFIEYLIKHYLLCCNLHSIEWMILQLKCSDHLRDIHCYIHRIGVNLIFLEACDNFFFPLSGEHPFSSLPPFLLPSGYFRRHHHHPVSPHRRHLPAAATLILQRASALSKLRIKGSKDNKCTLSVNAILGSFSHKTKRHSNTLWFSRPK